MESQCSASPGAANPIGWDMGQHPNLKMDDGGNEDDDEREEEEEEELLSLS